MAGKGARAKLAAEVVSLEEFLTRGQFTAASVQRDFQWKADQAQRLFDDLARVFWQQQRGLTRDIDDQTVDDSERGGPDPGQKPDDADDLIEEPETDLRFTGRPFFSSLPPIDCYYLGQMILRPILRSAPESAPESTQESAEDGAEDGRPVTVTHYQVYDGLQRVLTLTILLAVLRDRLEDAVLSDRLHALIEVQPEVYRVTPPGLDTTLPRLIQPRGQAYIKRQKRGKPPTALSSRVLAVLKVMQNEVKRLRASVLADFVRFLIQDVFVTCVEVADERVARQTFVSTNDRGVRLDPADVLKGLVAEMAEGVEEVRQVTALWDEIREKSGNTFTELLRLVDVIERTETQGPDWYVDLADHLREGLQDMPILEWVQRLERYQSAHRVLRTLLYHGGAQAIEQDIWRLHVFWWPEWMPLALFWVEQWQSRERSGTLKPQALSAFGRRFDALHRRCMALVLAEVQQDTRARIFCKALAVAKRRSNHNPFAHDRPLALTPIQWGKVERALNTPFEDEAMRASFVKWLEIQHWRPGLPALMRGDADRSEKDRARGATLEHVLPLNPAAGSQWMSDFPDDPTWFRCCHSLGNFAIISYGANDRAQNADFADKYDILRREAEGFELVRSVVDCERWDEATIDARSAAMRVLARRYLGVPDGVRPGGAGA